MTGAVLRIGDPPSLNTMLNTHWRKSSSIKKRLQAEITAELQRARVPKGISTVSCELEFVFPTNRRRDQGNFRAPMEKALGDALTKGGWLVDDTHEDFTVGRTLFLIRPLVDPHALVRMCWERAS